MLVIALWKIVWLNTDGRRQKPNSFIFFLWCSVQYMVVCGYSISAQIDDGIDIVCEWQAFRNLICTRKGTLRFFSGWHSWRSCWLWAITDNQGRNEKVLWYRNIEHLFALLFTTKHCLTQAKVFWACSALIFLTGLVAIHFCLWRVNLDYLWFSK